MAEEAVLDVVDTGADTSVDSSGADTGADEGSEESSQNTTQSGDKADKSQTDKIDKRATPDALRKALKYLEENGGEHSAQANDIRKALGETKSYKSAFPTVKEAREAKLALEAVGGSGKIAELQAYNARMQEVDSMLEAGDPRVIDAIFETPAMGAGLAKVLPNLLEKLIQSHPQDVQKTIKPYAVGFMDSQGLAGAIDAMANAFNAEKPDDAKAILGQIVNWYKKLLQDGNKTAKVDPEREAWQKERETFEQNRYKGEVELTFSKVMAHAEQTLDRILAPNIKRLGLSTESANLLRADAWKYLEQERNKDPLFMAGIVTRINDKQRKVSPDAAQFLNSMTDAKAKAACEKALRVRYGHVTGTTTVAKSGDAKKTVTTPPSGAAPKLDHAMTIKKLGHRGAQDAVAANKGFDKSGKAIKKVAGVWKYS